MPAGRAAQWAGGEVGRGGAAESDKDSHFWHAKSRAHEAERQKNNGRVAG